MLAEEFPTRMATYVSVRIDPVPAIVPSIFFNREDSAPAHITNVIQKRPPSSPDINSMDFAVWSILERDVSTRFYPNLHSLKAVIESNQVRRENGGAFMTRGKGCHFEVYSVHYLLNELLKIYLEALILHRTYHLRQK